jgi:thiol-disulfide isomerase/thioredoxin
MRAFAVLTFLAVALDARAVEYGCEPAPAVAPAISRVQSLRDGGGARDDLKTQARQILEVAVRSHPDDVFANLEYLFWHRAKGHDDVIARYRAAMQQRAGDRRYQLFYAASLIGTNTPEALRRLTELASPDFPYPYLLIGQIRSYQKFEDKAALTANLVRFVSACPSYLRAYELLGFAGIGEELGSVAVQLRTQLAGRSDREAVMAYRWLWRMEFRVTPPAGHAALRTRVEEDVTALNLRPTADDLVAVVTLREAYRLTKNDVGLKSLPVIETDHPVFAADRQWRKDHPVPAKNATLEEIRTYYAALAEAARTWISKWPEQVLPYTSLLRALEHQPAPEAEIVAAGEQLIAVSHKHSESGRPAVIEVARVYVSQGIKLAEVPAMIEAGLREAETSRPAPEYDFFDDRNYRLNEETRLGSRIQARSVQFDWSVRTSKLDTAGDALSAMRGDLDALVAVTTQKGFAGYLDSQYWTKMAQLADLQGRRSDADEYRRAAENARNPATPVQSAAGRSTLEGKPLPPLRLTGLDGRVWTSADLDGKVAVLNVWATWCRPCVEELAELQKLHQVTKGRSNVVILSLNVDSNPGVVQPFVDGRSWTFPVLLAHDYVNRILPDLSIPRTWIVQSGVVRSEDIGFNADAWIKRMLERLDREGAGTN